MPFLQKQKPKESVFGSYARGDAEETSDLDLLVEFEPSISLITFVRYKRELEKLLGKKLIF